MLDIDSLNEPQREAVLCTEGPLLVLAGAGSGKTRVLTYRIAHMVQDLNVPPWQIMAITFTNKAANEMRERLGRLVGPSARGMWVSTFHSMCVRILRVDCELLGFSKSFTIYDDDDTKRLLKDVMAGLDLDPKRWPVNSIRGKISQAKNELKAPGVYADEARDPVSKVTARVYAVYQERLKMANAFDFDDLLMYTYLLFKNHPDVLEAYQDRFRYLLVDEYQDTNHAQYAITKLLAAKHQNIMVVGDDDQSIYSWRGADIRNILEFEQDYPQARSIKLEQNYRSSGNILNAANAVVAHNTKRKQKRLFTESGDGEKILVYMASDERDEGRWIAGEIDKLHNEGVSYEEMAVFYRTNAQSRSLEDMLLRAGVPYRIVGGTKFFDRAEIRDVIAYLTLCINPADDMAAKRVINQPRRGIGKTTIEHIENVARNSNLTFMQAAEWCLADETLQMRTRNAIGGFVGLINDAQSYGGELRKVIEAVIDRSQLIQALEQERTDEAESRIENIKEFLSVVDEYVESHEIDESALPPEGINLLADTRQLSPDSLEDFLEWVRLRTDLDAATDDDQFVTLMTVHSSKGLEFDCVFVAGMEETLFPHSNSSRDPQGLEEERRLAYVAITRARKRLYLTCAYARQIFGETHANPVSRFVGEIPSELRKSAGLGSSGFAGTGWEKRGSRRGISGSGKEAGGGRVFGQSSAGGTRPRSYTGRTSPNAEKKSAARVTFAVGDIVDHKTFGRGRVTKVDGDTLHIKFSKGNVTKKLLKDYAPIVKINL
ncbi:ATP-dependent DNA helicase pcrA [Slackia heliotrinireducens]|uniref:DNA 3'-5' helicase n=1 Tax=Slackia heliotrinireducens (strain ATCC 29202 / DSM 20476 / NCTC 11029 / RHS 1) TaxID=471855 RepID=C7N6W8_SLAHD|nr:UvrD-helicase domain-containing protein [Slackia heliotrinireducens]ACV22653.1 DNA/RNA helicase, superfamily I [Slackia heliotrinireducens DSM 20476]VEH01214.1 ATP-dependent DNA helicase pcrA [Slackia heliotrinireducens]